MKSSTLLPLMFVLGASSAFAAVDTEDNSAPTVLHAKGNVLSQDIFNNELVMLLREDGSYRQLTYSLNEDTDLTREGRVATLDELERGDLIKVEYIREGDLRSALRIAAFDSPPPAPRPPEFLEEEGLLPLGEPLPLFSESQAQREAVEQATEFVLIPSKAEHNFPTSNGSFVRQRWFNQDAFIVSTPGRWLRHRETYHLEPGAVVYQDDHLSQLEQLRRGDAVEVVYEDTGKRYMALEVQSNKREVVASKD